MGTPTRIHLGLEILSSPLWIPYEDGKLGTHDVGALPLSATLQGDLLKWAADYDRAFDFKRSTFDVHSESARKLHDDGLALWRRLVEELGAETDIHYDSPVFGESFRIHHALAKTRGGHRP